MSYGGYSGSTGYGNYGTPQGFTSGNPFSGDLQASTSSYSIGSGGNYMNTSPGQQSTFTGPAFAQALQSMQASSLVTASILGIPIWLLVAGAVVLVIANRR